MEKNKEYYESLDKRTKEYKEWVLSQDLQPHTPLTQEELESKHKESPTIETVIGAGDIVEGITKATGIKKLVEIFTPEGKDCGCDDRKETLNKLPIFNNKRTVKCLTVDEYVYLSEVLKDNKPISNKHIKRLLEIYERVFNVKIVSSCNGCSLSGKYGKITQLKAVLGTYQ